MNRTLTSIAGVALCVAALVPASASAKTVTLRYFEVTNDLVLTQPDGTVVDHPPYPEAGPGARLDIFAVDYLGNHKKHEKKPSASSHTTCVFADAPEPTCEANVAIGGSLLYFKGLDIARGTGKFRGATGTAVTKTVSEEDNSSDVIVKVKLK